MRSFAFIMIIAASAAGLGAASQDIRRGYTPFQEPPVVTHAVFNPETVIPRTRVVYIREYSNWTPPNGAPIFYAPYPNTLCMLGEGTGHEVRIIYERQLGACEQLIQVSDGQLVRPIKHRQAGDHLRIGTK